MDHAQEHRLRDPDRGLPGRPLDHHRRAPGDHVDIPGRSGPLLGATFTNQDFHLFFFVLIGIGLALFVVTSLFGRVWCGFACPQTVFMEGIFRPIERLIEGRRLERIRRNGKGGADKVWRKVLKHAIFIFLSWNFAIAFMCYFIPPGKC